MSDELKSFPPSERKLEQLRDAGEFPVSSIVFSSSIILSFVASLYGFNLLFLEKTKELAQKAFNSEEHFSLLFNEYVNFYFMFFAYVCFLFIGFISIFGFIQSKFYLNFSLFRLDFSRLLFSFRFSLTSLLSFSLLALVVFVSWVIAYSSLVKGLDLASFSLFRMEESINTLSAYIESKKTFLSDEIQRIFLVLNPVVIICVFISLILGLSSYFIRRFIFMRKHMMSRNEIEAEFREQEVSFEFKETMSERRFE